jgi:hypothetical protein
MGTKNHRAFTFTTYKTIIIIFTCTMGLLLCWADGTFAGAAKDAKKQQVAPAPHSAIEKPGKTAPSPTIGPSPDTMQKSITQTGTSLKQIGVMIAEGKSMTEVQNVWRTFVQHDNELNIDVAIQTILYEAKSEAAGNVNSTKKQAQFYLNLKAAIRRELAQAREIYLQLQRSDVLPRFYRKIFNQNQKDSESITITQGKIITTNEDLIDYIHELEELLDEIGNDSQLADIDLQNALQRQQEMIKMLSNIEKALHDTATAIIKKIRN